jgi:hypothetical protein
VTLRVGYFGARSDARGLAYQGLSYCKHLDFDRIYGIDMTADNLSPYECDWRPYESLPSDLYINRHSKLEESDVRHFLRGLDVVFGAETFYREELVDWAREEGVRTVLACNPEFSAWGQRRDTTPRPDILTVPTTWRMDQIPDAIHLPFPVDRLEFPFRLRNQANRFVHVAGHTAMGDRAGTRIVLGALARLRNIDIVIRTQSGIGMSSPGMKGVVQEGNVATPQELYADADVVIIPRRYGGNSLTIQEALSVGCPVIALDREPENQWGGVLTLPSRVRGNLRSKGGIIPMHDASPQKLFETIRLLVSDPMLVERTSYAANEHARSISWDRLLPMYERFFEAVASGENSDVLRGITEPFLRVAGPDLSSTPA